MDNDATKVVARSGPLLASLQKVLNDDLAKDLPKSHLKAAQKMQGDISNFESQAKEVLSGSCKILGFDMAKFDDSAKTTKRELLRLEAFVATIRKHG